MGGQALAEIFWLFSGASRNTVPAHVEIILSVLVFPVPYNKKEKENSCQRGRRVVNFRPVGLCLKLILNPGVLLTGDRRVI